MSETGGEVRPIDPRDYLRVLRQRAWVVVIAVVVLVAAVLVLSLRQTKVYQASTEVLLRSDSTENLFDEQANAARTPAEMETEIKILTGEPIRSAVEEGLGYPIDVSADQVGQTDVIAVTAESTDPDQAAEAANTYVESYIDIRRQEAVDELLAASQQIQTKIDELQRELDPLSAQIAQVPEDAPPDNNLTIQRDALLSQQNAFKLKLDELQVDTALKSGGAELVTPADVPTDPVRPTPVRNGLVALGMGLVLGVALAFAFEYLDDSVKSEDDLVKATGGVAVLGIVPTAEHKDKAQPEVKAHNAPTSAVAEAYRALRTSVQFMGLDRPVRTLQVTSPISAEGKTTTVANLATVLAQAGQEVVVLDCDLRRPRIHTYFGLDNDMGFTSVLLGEVGLTAALQEVPGQKGLLLLASGPVPPNPAELLSSVRTRELLSALVARSGFVLVDSPPVLPVTDAVLVAARVEATLLVAKAGVTTRKRTQRAAAVLRQVDARLVGTVLNQAQGEGAYRYAYGYPYYGEPAPNGTRSRWRRGSDAGVEVS